MDKWYFLRINHLPAYRKKVLLFLCSAFQLILVAQVYNYDPIRYSNSEVNPAYLTNDEYKRSFSVLHHSSFSPTAPLHYSSVRYSILPGNHFSGFGISLNNTYYGEKINYSTAGLGAAYRTILLNEVYLRVGAFYKANFISAPAGRFDFGAFIPDTSDYSVQKKFVQNLNLSFSLSTSRHRAYLNGGILNYWPSQPRELFPVYYYLNIGDLGKLLSDDRFELNYTVLIKKYPISETLSYSNYVSVMLRLPVTRESTIRYGTRIGIADNRYLQVSPALNYYARLENRNYLALQILFDVTFKNNNQQNTFPPGGQLSLFYYY